MENVHEEYLFLYGERYEVTYSEMGNSDLAWLYFANQQDRSHKQSRDEDDGAHCAYHRPRRKLLLHLSRLFWMRHFVLFLFFGVHLILFSLVIRGFLHF